MAAPEQRTGLQARSRLLRERVVDLNSRLKDRRAKEFLQTSVFNHLDDVDDFLLADAKSGSSSTVWTSTWLDAAETMLRIAEQSFETFEVQVKRYGGPEHVRLIG
ncbi:MAG: hypothetical protein U0Q55_18740 [Vicinamibacterales bacterium]